MLHPVWWLGLCAMVAACSRNPADLIPASDRLLLQQEAAQNAKPLTVEQMLARARGDKPAAPAPQSVPVLVIHIVENNGRLSIAGDDLKRLRQIGPALHQATLAVGPTGTTSSLAAAADADRRARFISAQLPATLHLTETRYDVTLELNTARLEFARPEVGDPAVGH